MIFFELRAMVTLVLLTFLHVTLIVCGPVEEVHAKVKSSPVQWHECPVYSDPSKPNPPNVTAHCAILSPCLNWSGRSNCTNEGEIELFVKRIQNSAQQAKKGQLWLLQGGPGTNER